MNYPILFVDDEPNILDGYRRQLRGQVQIVTAAGPTEGLAALSAAEEFSVVVSDMRMPEMDGVEFLKLVREKSPNSVRVMLTGNNDLDTAVKAINEGNIFRFLNKPVEKNLLLKALTDATRQYQLQIAEKELLEKTLRGSIKVLTDILSLIDPLTFGRGEELKNLVQRVSNELKLEGALNIELSAILSGIGAVVLPPALNQKMHKGEILNKEEERLAARIPEVGRDLIANIPRLEDVARIILYQNKRFDGTGYPKDEVRSESLPLGSRLLKILKDLLHLESVGNSRSVAIQKMRERAGWYDVHLLSKITDVLLSANPGSLDGEQKVLELKVRELMVGQILLKDVTTSSGMLLITAGNVITATILERLTNYAQMIGITEPIRVEGARISSK